MTTPTTPLLIQGGRLLDPMGELDAPPVVDVFLMDGRIAAKGEDARHMAAANSATQVVDAGDMLVMPGFVNGHYHSHDVLQRGLFEQIPLDVWSLQSFPSFYTRRTLAEVTVRTQLGAAECLRNGITTVQDMVTIVGPDREHADAILQAYEQAGLRVCLALQIGDQATIDTMPFWREMLPPELAAAYAKALSPGAMQDLVTDMLHSSSSERIRWALAPSTPERCSESLLHWVRDTAEAEDLRVFTHVYESRAQAVLARVRQQMDGGSYIRMLARHGLLNERLTIAHGIWIAEDEIDALAAAGGSLVSNPVANLKLLDGIAPVQRYLDAGVNVGLGGDNCSCSDAQSMFQAMKNFAIFLAYQGQNSDSSAAAQAFRAATAGSARALGLQGQVGCLDIGSRADLVLIDTNDPIYHPLHSAVRQVVYAESGRGVHTVIVAGKVALRDRKPTMLDEPALLREADALGAELRIEHAALVARNRELLKYLPSIRQRVNNYPLGMDRLRLA